MTFDFPDPFGPTTAENDCRTVSKNEIVLHIELNLRYWKAQ